MWMQHFLSNKCNASLSISTMVLKVQIGRGEEKRGERGLPQSCVMLCFSSLFFFSHAAQSERLIHSCPAAAPSSHPLSAPDRKFCSQTRSERKMQNLNREICLSCGEASWAEIHLSLWLLITLPPPLHVYTSVSLPPNYMLKCFFLSAF